MIFLSTKSMSTTSSLKHSSWWSSLKRKAADDWWSNLDHFWQVLRDGEYLHHDWILKARQRAVWNFIPSFKDESQQGDDCSMTAISWAWSTELHKNTRKPCGCTRRCHFFIRKQMTKKTIDIVDIGTRFGGCEWNNKLRADRRMICCAFW